ncbi:MAG: SDR family oxidoreductase [Chloroflexi bacterium]|nr:SDR family oxidoreductase [Chloroflexota bacterium]
MCDQVLANSPTTMDLGLTNKKVLVTGGSKGIGAAIAKALAAEGCRVSIVARDVDKLRIVWQSLGGQARGHQYMPIDLAIPGAPTRAAQTLASPTDPFDIVVHNVGGALGCKDPLAPVEDWQRVWAFNVGIAIELNRLLIPPMQKRRWGRVIHISSISAEAGEGRRELYGGAHPYAAAKAYLNAYVKGLGREMASSNVIVTAVMPGVILSEGKYWDKLHQAEPERVQAFLAQHVAIGRFGTAEEIAPFVVFLASQQASFAAGTIIPIDGGRM